MKKRRLFDEQGRIFGLISVVDILAVLVVVVLGAMLYQRFLNTGTASDDPGATGTVSATVECEILVSGVRSYSVDGVNVGDTLYFPGTENVLGTVTVKRTEQNTQMMNTLDGRVVEMPVDGYYDLYLTVECQGTVVEGRCYLKGTSELMKYMSMGVENRYVSMSGTIASFTYEVTK